MQTKTYDHIFIGTGMISVLEAIYQNSLGKSVLMLDKQNALGGAWLPVEIFNLHHVENAIHYFLDDPIAFKFMREVLEWQVCESNDKYRIFSKRIIGMKRLHYDNPFGEMLVAIDRNDGIRSILKILMSLCWNWPYQKKRRSVYVKGGCAEMLNKLKLIVNKTSIEIKYSTSIEDIFFNDISQLVEIKASKNNIIEKITGRVINFTHGTLIDSLKSQSNELKLERKIYPRPAIHMLVRDCEKSQISEAIFANNKIIKYAHDITKYSQEANEMKGTSKIIALALHVNIIRRENIFEEVFNELKKCGFIGECALLEQYCWWDVYLPALDDSDLERIKATFGERVSFLKTENFARGIGMQAHRWADRINFVKLKEETL